MMMMMMMMMMEFDGATCGMVSKTRRWRWVLLKYGGTTEKRKNE